MSLRHWTTCTIIAATVVLMSPAQSCSQTLPNGYLTVDGIGAAANPFNSTTSQIWQWVYDSGQFVAGGPITITGLSVRPSQPTLTSNGGTFPSLRVTMSASPNNYVSTAQSATFASNLSSSTTVVFNGSWSTGPVTASTGPTANWIPIPLTTPFNYDPTLGRDFLVQLEKCTTTTSLGIPLDASVGAVGTNGGNSYGNTGICLAPTRSTSNNESVPIIKIDYVLGNQRWQPNSPPCSLDLNGLTPPACTGGPIALTTCVSAPVVANINTTLTGNPFDLLFTAVPAVPSNAGGFQTPGGQHLNLNFADPSFTALFALTPMPIASTSLTAVIGGAGVISVQMVVIDPSHTEGCRLSAVNQLTTVNGVSVPGPIADNGWTTITTGALPLCGPQSIPFFGASYTQTHVLSNGRIMWGPTGNGDATPLPASALAQGPSVNAWCDLQPNNGGAITISAPTPNLLHVDWAGIPHYGSPFLLSTWFIEIDATTGSITISGLTSFAPSPPITGASNAMFLGLSRGSAGPTTDPGSSPFSIGGIFSGPTNPTDMLYEFGQAGTLAPGVSTLIFTPSLAGNYDWTGI